MFSAILRAFIFWDIIENPQLITDGMTGSDVKQGLLGDSWLLTALAPISEREELLCRVVPPDQGFDEDYAGLFFRRLP